MSKSVPLRQKQFYTLFYTRDRFLGRFGRFSAVFGGFEIAQSGDVPSVAAFGGFGRRVYSRPQKPVPYQHASSSLASGTIVIDNEL